MAKRCLKNKTKIIKKKEMLCSLHVVYKRIKYVYLCKRPLGWNNKIRPSYPSFASEQTFYCGREVFCARFVQWPRAAALAPARNVTFFFCLPILHSRYVLYKQTRRRNSRYTHNIIIYKYTHGIEIKKKKNKKNL